MNMAGVYEQASCWNTGPLYTIGTARRCAKLTRQKKSRDRSQDLTDGVNVCGTVGGTNGMPRQGEEHFVAFGPWALPTATMVKAFGHRKAHRKCQLLVRT